MCAQGLMSSHSTTQWKQVSIQSRLFPDSSECKCRDCQYNTMRGRTCLRCIRICKLRGDSSTFSAHFTRWHFSAPRSPAVYTCPKMAAHKCAKCVHTGSVNMQTIWETTARAAQQWKTVALIKICTESNRSQKRIKHATHSAKIIRLYVNTAQITPHTSFTTHSRQPL